MTNAEKQEIIEAVLAALATNSKTIAQLSPKQSLIDSDLFEVAGGCRVTYQTLRSLIREGLALESQLSNYVTGDAAMMYLAKLDTETGTVDYKESPLVMLDGFKGVNGYTPVTGDLYYENWSGYQIWIKTQGGATGVHANTHVAYVNKNDGAIYRWTGSSMVRIGGSAVINDLVTGGEADALSAEMGKKIRQNVTILLNRLGEYAFPNGKPTLDWSGGGGDDPEVPTYAVQKNIGTGLSASGGDDDVSEGGPLEVTISVINDLYIIDEDNVEVTMGGSPVQGAFDASTGKITIAEVYGVVVINVPSLTYVSSGLVFNLDGKNRGGVAGHWTDLASNVNFVLTNCTENSDNVQFNGNSKGVSNGTLNVLYSAGTIESIFDVSDSNYPTSIQAILTNNTNFGIGIGIGTAPAYQSAQCYCYSNRVSEAQQVSTGIVGMNNVVKTKQHISISRLVAYRNGQTLNVDYPDDGIINFGIDNTTPLAIGYRGRNLDSTPNENFMTGKIFCIRVYSRALTSTERMQNYKVDKKRFNLA